MKRLFLQFLYNIGFTVAFGVTWPYFTWRLWRRGRFWEAFPERVGLYSAQIREKLAGLDRPVWMHAVSVGEMMIARVLLAELRRFRPEQAVVLTTTTQTGRQVGASLEDERTVLLYNPTDFLLSVSRVFDAIRPSMLILIEQEIWPNYIWTAQRRGVPVWLINARLSRRSFRRFQKFRVLTEPVLRGIEWVCLQHEVDRARFAAIGFRSECLAVAGSMKFDVAEGGKFDPGLAERIRSELGWAEDTPVLLLGSSHPGEEALLLDMFHALGREFPELRLVLAPRHFERAGKIFGLVREAGWRVVRRSALGQAERPKEGWEVLVLDTTGELSSLYPLGTVNVIGKSILSKGGQNFIEAARCGRPVVVGPHMENFDSLVAQFKAGEGIVQVDNPFELFQSLRELLGDPREAARLGTRARELYLAHLGAGARTAGMIAATLDAMQGARDSELISGPVPSN
ncbi:MAG: 3-deoxy-D-manno-octulosonic acid transferase [Candidatus Methylacidiphilales bacterium]